MPKKFLDTDKRKWFELYEAGKTEIQIAKEYARCDLRTVRRGIEEARRKQDVVFARRELVKDALRKHQESLLQELDNILNELSLPTEDYVVLPWSHGGDSILIESETPASTLATAQRSEDRTVRGLLREHLRNDRLWKALALWEKARAAHLNSRIILQRKTVVAIQGKTGYKLVDRNDIPRPFLYSYTTGDLFFRATLYQAFGSHKDIDLEREITVNTVSGDVRYSSLVLAEAPGKEEEVKTNLINAFRELKGSPEAVSVVDTYKTLEEAGMRVRKVIQQIKLLGLIPGQCEICRRLGM
jgi:hypothetical protein